MMQSDSPFAVILLGNYYPDNQYSMQGITALLHRELERKGIPVAVIRPTAWAGRIALPGFARGLTKYLGYWDKYVRFPRKLDHCIRAIVADRKWEHYSIIVHIVDQGNAFYSKYLSSYPHLVTCHDLMAALRARGAIQTQSGRAGILFKIQQRSNLKGLMSIPRIICVSEHTRRDLLKLLPEKEKLVSSVRHALPFQPPWIPAERVCEILSQYNLAENTYLFNLSNNSWYKNRTGLLKIYEDFNRYWEKHQKAPVPILVCAGAPFSAPQQAWIKANGLQSRIRYAGRPSGEAIQALYRGARVFLFPSLYEGMGLPPLEAQWFSCPVIASNRAALPETLADSAILLDPEDANHPRWVQAMVDLCRDDTMNKRLIEKGRENVQRFNPSTMISDYLNIYQSLHGAWKSQNQ